MIESIGSTIVYMGELWVNCCTDIPAVFGVRYDTPTNDYQSQNQHKKSFEEYLKDAVEKQNSKEI